jgi:heme/copper-type cytochrome/quinol oxidase subunit 2
MKKTALTLILALLISAPAGTLYSGTVHASTELDSIPKPSVPEFTVKFIDSSYTTPTTYSIDPYTGQNVTHHGSYVANKTIEVTIKNQPFVPYYDASSGWISLYYGIRVKGHYEVNWTILYLREDIPYFSENVPSKSASEYTVLSYHSYQPNSENTYIMGGKMMDFPSGSQVDFQVEALAGYIHRVWNPNATSQLDMYPYVFAGEESGWSTTQTITVSPIPSPSPEPTPEPISTALVIAIVILVAIGTIALVVVIGAGLLVYLKKRKRPQEISDSLAYCYLVLL